MQPCLGDSEYAHAVAGQGFRRCDDRARAGGVEMAQVDDGLGCALRADDEVVAAVMGFPSVGKGKKLGRQRVLFAKFPAGVQVFRSFEELYARGEKRFLHGVEWIRPAGDDSEFQDFVEFLGNGGAGCAVEEEGASTGVKGSNRHAVFGEGAGLIHAEGRGGAQVLDGGHPAGENLAS